MRSTLLNSMQVAAVERQREHGLITALKWNHQERVSASFCESHLFVKSSVESSHEVNLILSVLTNISMFMSWGYDNMIIFCIVLVLGTSINLEGNKYRNFIGLYPFRDSASQSDRIFVACS